VVETLSGRARELFASLGPTYDRYARLLSFGQDPRWRSFLVSRLPVGPDDVVLDVATGTAAVALELVRRTGCSVVGVDQSPEMLEEARRRILLTAETKRIRLVEASAAGLPFEDGSFDGLTAAYLLRYLDDLPAGLAELAACCARRDGCAARLRRPAGRSARAPGTLRRRRPAARRTRDLAGLARGRPLPRRQHPRLRRALAVPRLLTRFREAGFEDVQPSASASAAAPSLGPRARDRGAAGVLRARARRLARLRHAAPPALHRLAPELRRDRRLPRAAPLHGRARAPLAAFFLALGISAHALDELNGRPLQTRIPDGVLVGSPSSRSPARSRSGSRAPSLQPLAARLRRDRARLVPAYNLELFGGAIHNAPGFALAGARSRC
jgi:SAM-dependent methyltransferase